MYRIDSCSSGLSPFTNTDSSGGGDMAVGRVNVANTRSTAAAEAKNFMIISGPLEVDNITGRWDAARRR